MHKQNSPYECIECSYSSYSIHELKWHVTLVHSKIKLFECKECKITFSEKEILMLHISEKHRLDKQIKSND